MKDSDFFVVGIGASAGGLDAIQQLFDHLPSDTGMAFVVIQHLSPDFKSLMPELLSKHTKMKIYTASDKQVIKPNCIYLNQRNKNLHIKGNQLYLLDKGPKNNLNLPIDIFFHTLGEEYKEKSAGVILSGTGSDGLRGIKTIKEAGGNIFAQDPTSAQFDGMPNSAIATNLCDFILSPEKMAEALSKMPGQRLQLDHSLSDDEQTNDIIFYKILTEVHKISGIDFRQYKRNTLLRRLEKRMNINNFDKLHDYQVFLRSSNTEKEALKQDFLIGVTSFFRDIEAFEILKKKIIPDLLKSTENIEPIRVWVAGCSTGEEVYSMAMLLDDFIRTNRLNRDFKIFATDVDPEALAKAGMGSFPLTISNELEQHYIEHYFSKSGDRFFVHKRIRDKIVFSNHNLLKDPPFIRMDLITCRNLLIYLEAKIQQKILMNFQFALHKFGYLFLGNSESLGKSSKFFKVIDNKWKIYQNISDTKKIPTQVNPEDKISTLSYRSPNSVIQKLDYRFKENPETVFHKYLSKKFSPSSIFVDKDFNIIFIKGDARKKLTHSEGMVQNNLLKMVSPETAVVIRNGIRRLEVEKKDLLVKDVVSIQDGIKHTFDLSFHKPTEENELNNIYLIHFSEDRVLENEVEVIEHIPFDEVSKQRLEDVESELKQSKIELQNVVEELETSNEELQSSNEELMASNEELQSTNEELQSVNEELYTVNAELQEKNKEMELVNDDMNNFLNSTEIGTLFLDVDLRIRKFTPALTRHFNLQPEDIGRSISGFASGFTNDDQKSIFEDCKKVLDKISVIEKEVYDEHQKSFLRRISPFISVDRKIEGVVITFIDITERVKYSKELIRREHFLNLAQSIAKLGHWELDLETNELYWSDSIFQMLGISKESFSNSIDDFYNFVHPADRHVVNEAFTRALETNTDYKVKHRFICPDGKVIFVEEKAEFSKRNLSGNRKVFGTVLDITELTKFQSDLIESEKLFKSVFEHAAVGIATVGKNGKPLLVNNELIRILGYSLEELQNTTFSSLTHPDDVDSELELYKKLMRGDIDTYHISKRFIKKDKSIAWIELTVSAFKDELGKVQYSVEIVKDISEQHTKDELLLKANIALERSENQFRALFENLSQAFALYKAIYDEQGNIIDYQFVKINRAYEQLIGRKADDCIGKSVKQVAPEVEGIWSERCCNVDITSDVLDFEGYHEAQKKHYRVIVYTPEKGFCATIFYDITSKKAHEESLEAAKQIAETANESKNRLMANISHEIRTPLNAIFGFTSLIKEEELDMDTQNKYLEVVYSNTQQVFRLIDDIMDLSKIEEGQLTLSYSEVDLNEIMRQTFESVQQIKKLRNKENLSIKLVLPDNVKPEKVLIDGERMLQILYNLILNAIKYTREGLIQFGYTYDRKKLEVFVKDTGIGIPEAQQSNIFKRYSRLDSDLGSSQGRGIGLTIVKGIVELMQGEIKLESKVGEGSKFYVTIPARPAKQKVFKPVKAVSSTNKWLEGKRILLAEDDLTARMLIEAYVKPLGAEVVIAIDGIEAIELYKSTHPDLVLMDLKMPRVDGFEAIAEIIKYDPKAAIVAESSYALRKEKNRCMELGCIDYLTKPISKSFLLSVLKKVFKA